MLHKTQGIVFRVTRYGETSVIASIFTGAFGLQSYMINGVRTKSTKSKMALYQPLTLLDLVVYHRENANLQRIREARCLHPCHHLHQDVKKSTVALFLTEIVNKAVKDQSHAEELCDFLIRSFCVLDESEHVSNFHLVFLTQLARHLGFGASSPSEIFDAPTDSAEYDALNKVLHADLHDTLPIDAPMRKVLLQTLLHFYQRHVGNFGTVHSLPVLQEFFA